MWVSEEKARAAHGDRKTRRVAGTQGFRFDSSADMGAVINYLYYLGVLNYTYKV